MKFAFNEKAEERKIFQLSSLHFQPGLLLRLWTVARLLLLIVALYFLWPDEFVWLATVLAIHLLGTLPERVAFFLFTALVLSGSVIFIHKATTSKLLRYLAPLTVSIFLFWGLFQLVPGLDPVVAALFLTGILAINTISDTWLVNFISHNPGRRLADIIFGVIIGTEIILLKPLLLWLPVRWGDWHELLLQNRQWLRRLSTAILVPVLGALLLSADGLADLHRTLFPNPAVQMFARGNFNWLELDLERRTLYAAGFGTNYLLTYNIEALNQSPRASHVENGYAQSFGYNPIERELYIYNELTQQLLVLEATTLELKKSISTPQIAPGDSWVKWEKFSDSIIIASEADEQTGYPFVALDRTTGKVLDALNVDPGSITFHPTKPLLYMSFFRRNSELLVYNTQLHKIVAKTLTPERLDRMIFAVVDTELELLIPSPADSAVLRFNPETLDRIGTIKTLFGARAIAIDSVHKLMLCGSLVTGMLEVIDLTTHQRIAEYYLGPWQRTISLDSQAGIAYISTHEGIFTLKYYEQPNKPIE
ncbi:MAG: hypothetical protein U0401_13745 [Anaerolineae bacterium]